MGSFSKQLAVMQDVVVEYHMTLIDVLLNGVDAGHIEADPVLTAPVALLKQESSMNFSRGLALRVVEDSL
jgi:hypothetical protein